MVKNLKIVKKQLQNSSVLEECARCFGVTGDPTRLKICYLLCNFEELSVSEIAEIVGVSISAVSHSLSRLNGVRLVKTRRDKQTIFYSLSSTPFAKSLRLQLDFI